MAQENRQGDGGSLTVLFGLLGIAVLAISSSAVLILAADAPAVSVTFWRTLGGALILAPAAIRSRRTTERSGALAVDRPTRSQWLVIGASGVALGTHFGTWLASLELTSVTASVTLVSTAPIFIAGWLVFSGRPPGRATWAAIALAVLGTAVITVGDAGNQDGVSRTGADAASNPLLGDGLALIGAATMAVYLVLGDRLRTTLSTAAYASRTYAVAAGSVLVFAVLTGTELTGYDTTTWLAIGAMILGPQLLGHTVLNLLLRRLGSVSVSLALLAEPVGAALLVWLIFREIPPATAAIGAPLVIAAVGLQILARRTAEPSAAAA